MTKIKTKAARERAEEIAEHFTDWVDGEITQCDVNGLVNDITKAIEEAEQRGMWTSLKPMMEESAPSEYVRGYEQGVKVGEQRGRKIANKAVADLYFPTPIDCDNAYEYLNKRGVYNQKYSYYAMTKDGYREVAVCEFYYTGAVQAVIAELLKQIENAEQLSEPKPWPTIGEFESAYYAWEKENEDALMNQPSLRADWAYHYLKEHAAPIGISLSDKDISEQARLWAYDNQRKIVYENIGGPEGKLAMAQHSYETGYKAAQTTSIPRATIDEVVEALITFKLTALHIKERKLSRAIQATIDQLKKALES